MWYLLPNETFSLNNLVLVFSIQSSYKKVNSDGRSDIQSRAETNLEFQGFDQCDGP